MVKCCLATVVNVVAYKVTTYMGIKLISLNWLTNLYIWKSFLLSFFYTVVLVKHCPATGAKVSKYKTTPMWVNMVSIYKTTYM